MKKKLPQKCHAELDLPTKQWVQRIVGRELRNDEHVGVRVFTVRPTPPATERQAAYSRLERLLDTMGERTKNLPEQDLDDASDEAMKAVRSTYEPLR